MPEDMYKPVRKCLPKVWKKLKMPLMDRHAAEAVLGADLQQGATERFEYIYVWKKVGRRPMTDDCIA
jgi:hypothetical protein